MKMRILYWGLLLVGAMLALGALFLPGRALPLLNRGHLDRQLSALAPALAEYHSALQTLADQGADAGKDGALILQELLRLSLPAPDAARILALRSAHHRGLPTLQERLSTLAGPASGEAILALRRASCSLETGLEGSYSLVASARLSQLLAALLLMLAAMIPKWLHSRT